MNHYSDQKLVQEIEKIMNKVSNLEKDTLRNFVTYWLVRKADPFNADNIIRQMTRSHNWLNIIESNNKFRVMYGEKMANEIVKMIEENQYVTSSSKADSPKMVKKRVK